MVLQYKWSSRQCLRYVALSIITGPKFLSERQTIKRLLSFIFLRQVYCNLVRFDFFVVVLFSIRFFTLDVNNCRLFSISLEAGGGFHGEGM